MKTEIFNILHTLNKEHLKISDNRIIYSEPNLKLEARVSLDHNSFDKIIIYLLKKELIGINKTVLPNGAESYFILNAGSIAMANFFSSEMYKKHEREDIAYSAYIREHENMHDMNVPNANEGQRLFMQWTKMIDEFFNQFNQVTRKENEVTEIYNKAIWGMPDLNMTQQNQLVKHCFYVYDNNPFNELENNAKMAKEYLVTIL